MSKVKRKPADSWREAAEWIETSLGEGDLTLRFFPRVIEWVTARGYADSLWAHTLDGGLAISLSPAPEHEPFLTVWSDDDWPYYEVELWDQAGRRVLGWFCDGEEEL